MRRLVFLVVLVLVGLQPAPVGAAEAGNPAPWRVQVPLGDLAFHPAGAGGASDLAVVWANGSATATVDLPATATHLLFEARADRCAGVGPVVEVRVDGTLLMTHEVVGNNELYRYEGWWRWDLDDTWAVGTYALRGEWGPGRHHLSFRFTNDHLGETCDRNLKLARIQFAGPDPSGGPVPEVDIVQFVDRETATVEPAGAGPRSKALLYAPGTLRVLADSFSAEHLHFRLWGRCRQTAPIEVRVDGEPLRDQPGLHEYGGAVVSYADAFGRPGRWPDGTHVIEVELGDDGTSCDAHVGVSDSSFRGTVRTAASPPAGPRPEDRPCADAPPCSPSRPSRGRSYRRRRHRPGSSTTAACPTPWTACSTSWGR